MICKCVEEIEDAQKARFQFHELLQQTLVREYGFIGYLFLLSMNERDYIDMTRSTKKMFAPNKPGRFCST